MADGHAADQSGSDSLLIGQIYHMPAHAGRGPSHGRLEPERELGYVTGAPTAAVSRCRLIWHRDSRDGGARAGRRPRRAKDISLERILIS